MEILLKTNSALNLKQRLLPILILSYCYVYSQDTLKVGMSAPISGPYHAYGLSMRLGINAYFHKVNASGGVNNYRLKLITMDDGYNPQDTRSNMEKFAEDESVIAVIGSVGTPTAKEAIKVAKREEKLLFGALTGAEILRKSPNKHVINFRASYCEEAKELLDYLLQKGILPYEIALFLQNDGYGRGYSTCIKRALQSAGFKNFELIEKGYFDRKSMNIDSALIKIVNAEIKPKVIMMAGTPAPCAELIRIMRNQFSGIIYTSLSFMEVTNFQSLIGDYDQILMTQVVPNPVDTINFPIVKSYVQDLRNYDKEAYPNFISLEGYIIAKLFTQAVEETIGNVTSSTIIDSMLRIKNREIGMKNEITFQRDDMYQGSTKVWISEISKDKIEYKLESDTK